MVIAGEDLIKETVQRLLEGWNCHDVQAFAALFAEDAEVTNVQGVTVQGRDGIEAFHAPYFKSIFANSHLNSDELSVRMLKPDLAVVDIHWSMTGARGLSGNERPLRKGLMSLVLVAEHGNWLIAVMHNMELPVMEKQI
jgi:uncharacterized protein (TIGR02246 family)